MKKRLFVAINLDISTKMALAKIGTKLPNVATLNKTKVDNLHLTLQFLGEVDENVILALQEQLNLIAQTMSPFLLEFQPISAFPNWQRAHTIITKVTGPQLTELSQKINSATSQIIAEIDFKPFQPHITISRIKSPLTTSLIGQIQDLTSNVTLPCPMSVNSIDLMASTLAPAGSVYQLLSRHMLAQ